MSIKINLLINKPTYTANLGENNFRVYTPGEAITEQKDFMRLVSPRDFGPVTWHETNGNF